MGQPQKQRQAQPAPKTPPPPGAKQKPRKKKAPRELPDKLYYSISEVSRHTGVKPHVLRYWEQEFPTLRPKKNRAGNRSYRRKDVDEILAIRELLYERGFKIDGARKMLREREGGVGEAPRQLDLMEAIGREDRGAELVRIRKGLKELLEFLRHQ